MDTTRSENQASEGEESLTLISESALKKRKAVLPNAGIDLTWSSNFGPNCSICINEPYNPWVGKNATAALASCSKNEPSEQIEVQPSQVNVRACPSFSDEHVLLVGLDGDGFPSLLLTNLDVLNCPMCHHPFSLPIYQCKMGHISCVACCGEMQRCAECPSLSSAFRCRAMEKVMESLRSSCRYKKHGCPATFHYSNKLLHESECSFSHCVCPDLLCDYVGTYDETITQFRSNHVLLFGCGSPSLLLTDLDVLNCTICSHPLCLPIFQCEKGHVSCASCCVKMKRKCAKCPSRGSVYRCRAMENVMESLTSSCLYQKQGCPATFRYSDKRRHESECSFGHCVCPHARCDYVGTYNELTEHFRSNHSQCSNSFVFNSSIPISLPSGQRVVFFQEENEGAIFILHYSLTLTGTFEDLITLVCVAPHCSSKRYAFDLTLKCGGRSTKLESVAENNPGKLLYDFALPIEKCLTVRFACVYFLELTIRKPCE